jgi:hypothetical protein
VCKGHPPTRPDRDLNSAAPASFVSWVGLLAVPFLYSSYPDKERPPNEPIDRSIPLVLLAAFASVVFVFDLGPGIRFSW